LGQTGQGVGQRWARRIHSRVWKGAKVMAAFMDQLAFTSGGIFPELDMDIRHAR
jgi:hypothetical protein